jgi:serine/threonine-protein phosphatase PP1 catalytic subunit
MTIEPLLVEKVHCPPGMATTRPPAFPANPSDDIACITDVYDYLLKHERLADGAQIQIDAEELRLICLYAKSALQKDPILLELHAPIVIVGDIHGQFVDLLKYFRMLGRPGTRTFLFLGDYVDRGYNSIETAALLFCAKVLYGDTVYLLRGNHETKDISALYGFKEECDSRFGDDRGTEIWEQFNDVFDHLPLAAIVDGRMFCVHGGISKDLPVIRDLLDGNRFSRPLQVPESGPVLDFLWADPSTDCPSYQVSDRGASFTFGVAAVDDFLCQNSLQLIVRAHQIAQNGFDFPFNPSKTVLTVFSCPNYAYECRNHGAVVVVDENLACDWRTLKCREPYDDFLRRIAREADEHPLRRPAERPLASEGRSPLRDSHSEVPDSGAAELPPQASGVQSQPRDSHSDVPGSVSVVAPSDEGPAEPPPPASEVQSPPRDSHSDVPGSDSVVVPSDEGSAKLHPPASEVQSPPRDSPSEVRDSGVAEPPPPVSEECGSDAGALPQPEAGTRESPPSGDGETPPPNGADPGQGSD